MSIIQAFENFINTNDIYILSGVGASEKDKLKEVKSRCKMFLADKEGNWYRLNHINDRLKGSRPELRIVLDGVGTVESTWEKKVEPQAGEDPTFLATHFLGKPKLFDKNGKRLVHQREHLLNRLVYLGWAALYNR